MLGPFGGLSVQITFSRPSLSPTEQCSPSMSFSTLFVCLQNLESQITGFVALTGGEHPKILLRQGWPLFCDRIRLISLPASTQSDGSELPMLPLYQTSVCTCMPFDTQAPRLTFSWLLQHSSTFLLRALNLSTSESELLGSLRADISTGCVYERVFLYLLYLYQQNLSLALLAFSAQGRLLSSQSPWLQGQKCFKSSLLGYYLYLFYVFSRKGLVRIALLLIYLVLLRTLLRLSVVSVLRFKRSHRMCQYSLPLLQLSCIYRLDRC